jgi:hypothetical protein
VRLAAPLPLAYLDTLTVLIVIISIGHEMDMVWNLGLAFSFLDYCIKNPFHGVKPFQISAFHDWIGTVRGFSGAILS